MQMSPEEAGKLLHAYVDGELDPGASLELEAYLAQNPAARAACERLRAMSAAIRDRADYHAAPAGLAARLRAAVPAEPEQPARRRPAWFSWLKAATAFGAVALVTWVIAVGQLRLGEEDRITRDVLGSHSRASLAGRPLDVASSDQHTVKPWLSAHLDFSPPVTDLSAHGFVLAGARLDYVGERPVATLVYHRRLHSIDLFVWPGHNDATERAIVRDGFNVVHFARNGMNFWVVSDLNRNELSDFSRLIAERSGTP
jgi:anti-sigma factor RsiW